MALLQLCFVREIPPQERRRKRSDQSQVNSAAEFLPVTNAVGVGVGVGVEGVDCGRRQKTASAAALASKQCEYKKPVSLPPNQIQPSQACPAWKI